MDINQFLSLYRDGQRDFSEWNLQGQLFKGETLTDVDFTDAKLNGADFTKATLNRVKFDNADIRGTKFINSELENVSFRKSIVGIQIKWLLISIIGVFLVLVLSSFPFAIAFWWVPFFGINFKHYPIFIVWAVIVLLGFLYFVAQRKTEEIFPWIILTAGLNAGVFGIYGILFRGSLTLTSSVGMVIFAIAIGIGVIASSIAGAGSLAAFRVMIENIANLFSNPNYIKKNSSRFGVLGLITISTLSSIVSGSLTGKCAELILSQKGTATAMAMMMAHADKLTILVTASGGVLAIILSTIISFFIDHEKYKSANNFSNRIAALKGTNFQKAILNNVDFGMVVFYCISFDQTKIVQTNLEKTKGHNRVFGWRQNLQDKRVLELVTEKKGSGNFRGKNLEEVNLEGAILSNIDFQSANLTNANLKNATLTDAIFIDANLTQVNLQGANLQGAKLVRTNLHDANLTGTTLTGACIDNWGRTATTVLSDITCEYINTKHPDNKHDDPHPQPHDPRRQPHKGNFEEGEFLKYISEYFNSLDLYHKHDFNFRASLAAILQLQEENPESKIKFANLKRCGEDKWLVKVEVDQTVNREQIREDYNFLYYNLCLCNQQKNQLIRLLTGKTEHRVILALGKGSFTAGFSSVRVSIDILNEGFVVERRGKLPVNPQLPELYHQLMTTYLPTKESEIRAKRKETNPSNISLDELEKAREQIHKVEESIKNNINEWLGSNDFAPILQFIQSKLNIKTEEILFCIETEPDLIDVDPNEVNNYTMLRKMPWHLWNFLDEYQNTEIAFTKPERERQTKFELGRNHIRVLSILGNDLGINVQKDKVLLEQYLDTAELVFLEKKSKNEIISALNNPKGWDIISFSGHRSENWDELAINSHETISAQELEDSLVNALRNGLQLVMLNACNTLKLARELENLYIPQVIVMKENVPDVIAHKFLESFLKFFTENSVAISMRKAREELSRDDSIGAWIPVLCQNAAERQVTLKDLPRQY